MAFPLPVLLPLLIPLVRCRCDVCARRNRRERPRDAIDREADRLLDEAVLEYRKEKAEQERLEAKAFKQKALRALAILGGVIILAAALSLHFR